MPFWTDNYTYTFYSKAYDKAGNIQNNFVVGSSSHTIRIDKLMPVVSVSSPAQSGIYSVFPTVYGTASDQNPNTASGINGASNIQVSVSYVDGGTTYYFDGASSFINTLNEYNSFFNATGWSASGPSSGTWTFEPAGLSSALVGNKIYRVRARAQDNAIPIPNPSDLMLNVATNYNIIYDTTPPVSMVTLPINGSTVNAVSIIAGSVSDNMAGVSDKSQILLSICEVQPAGMCWNGVVPGTFTVAGEVFYPLDNDASLNGSYSNGSWQITAPAFRDGYKYRVRVKARDNAIPYNEEVDISSITFIYDTTPPNINIIKPINNRYYGANVSSAPYYLDMITGTASDTFGVNRVEISLYDVIYSSYWYNTGGWTVGASSFNYVGDTNWSYSTPPLSDGHRYRLEVRAYDIAGNLSPYVTYYFYYDKTAPSVNITKPGNAYWYNNVNQIEGTATDPNVGTFPSGMYHTYTAIQQNPPTGMWWDGSGFNSSNEVWLIDTNNSWPNWTLTGASTPTWTTNTLYRVKSQAYDISRNTSTIYSVDFVYDTQIPTITVLTPEALITHYSSISWIVGTSADTNGLGSMDKVELRVKSFTNNQYWDWGSANYTQANAENAWFISQTTNNYANWISTGTPNTGGITFANGTQYEINFRAWDKATNFTTLYTTRTFVYDIGKPTGALTTVGGNGIVAYHSIINPINGTATDTPNTNSAGLDSLANGGSQIRILDVDSNKWWNYTNNEFDITDGNNGWFNANTGTSGNWSYDNPQLNTKSVSGHRYLIQYRGKDKSNPANIGPSSNGTDSNFTVGKDSVTITYDITPPISRVVGPIDGSTVNVVNYITGTATDTISGISDRSQIFVSICEVQPAGMCWNGLVPGTFTVAGEVFYPLDNDASLNGSYSNGSWQITAPAFRDGYKYRVRVKARDNALPYNEEVNISSISFVYDTTPPEPVITYPISLPDSKGNINFVPTVSGTIYEPFSIDYASIAVQEADTLNYYDPQTSTFNSLTQKWIGASITGTGPNYNFSVLSPALSDNKNYNIYVKSGDKASNSKVGDATVIIRYDVTPPLSDISFPVNLEFYNFISSVTGTSSDPNSNPSGVKNTQIRIQQLFGSNYYWNGTLWVSAETWLNPVSGLNWTKTTQLPPNNTTSGFEDNGLYEIKSRAFDIAGNTQTVLLTGAVFRFDTSSPTAVITQPINGYRYNSLNSITGTAQDSYNVRFPLVRIYDISLNAYWNGTIWAKDTTDDPNYPEIWLVTNSSSSTGSPFGWSLNTSAVSWPDRDNGLRADVKVIDRAGNFNIFSSTFSFDKTPPQTNITYPPVNDVRYSSMSAINGNVYDQTSNINSVYIRMWYINGGTTYYFSPATPHWNLSDTGWWSVSGTNNLPKGVINNWSYTNSDFTNPGNLDFVWKESTNDGKNGKKFYIAARSVDMTTNMEVSYTTRTFIFDNEGPITQPIFPEPNSSYNNIPTIIGTVYDDSPINWIKVSILNQDTTKYFDGSGFNSSSELWLDVSNIYQSSWTYINGLLNYTNGNHYVIKSSGTDIIGNIQSSQGIVRFLYDTSEPNSYVAIPQNGLVYNDDRVVLGNASDPGYIHQGINGTGSGVYPYAGWAKGKVQVCIFRDTEPLMGISGPATYGAGTGWDSSGYFWNGSTWTAVSGGPVWVDATFTDQLGNWSYDGLVCDDDSERANNTCWVKGYPYHAWIRAQDNANNLQSIISAGPRFYIAAPARSFLVSFAQGSFSAGTDVDVTVEAKDGDNGTGARAAAYQSTVTFYVDGVPGGPETMDSDYILDDVYGLPPATKFEAGDYGIKTFKVRLRKSGIRALRVQDQDNPSIYGSQNATVNPDIADRISIIADYDLSGEQPDPGTVSGKKGAPRQKLAGASVTYLLQVTDKYWNPVMSSATTVNVSDDDPNNDSISPNLSNFVFTGTATITRVFVSANSSGWKVSALGAGNYPNNNNPSSPVIVNPNPADRLLLVMPGESVNQGKFAVEPKGKNGVPDPQRAGVPFNITAYSVDPYYNIVSTNNIQVWVDIPTDKYYIKQPTQTLVNGSTTFTLTPVVASTHNIFGYTLQLSNTYYVTPNPVNVWWNSPVKLQVLAEGEFIDSGKPPYDSNPTSGGKTGTKAGLTAGVTSYVTVNLVDNYFNIVKGTTPWLNPANNNPIVKIDFLNDSNITARNLVPIPYTKSLINGTTTFSFIPVTRNQSSGLSIRATDTGATGTNYSTDTVSGIIVNPNSPVSLLLFAPGESPSEGSITGKSGTLNTLTAGTTYQILVRSVDLYNNKSPDGRSVKLTANDIYADMPVAAPLANGEILFDGFVPSASTGNLVINAVDNDSINPKLATSTVSGINVVPGTAVRLMWRILNQYLVAGKNVYPYGVDGNVSTQTAGVGFDAYVYAVDSRYNPTTVSDRTIRITSDDPFYSTVGNFNMTAGTAVITGITFRTASPRKLTATDLTGSPTLISQTSVDIPVNPNTPTKLRVLLPGESRVPGDNNPITKGRTGTPSTTLKAGDTFYVTVDITDSFWNLVPGASQEIRVIIDDPFGTVIPSSQVVITSATFAVIPRRAGPISIRAEMVNDPPLWGPVLSVDTATPVNINPNIARRLLVLLPGESFYQGSYVGKQGSLNQTITAGVSFNVTVGVVDDYFNLVPGRAVTVKLNTPVDGYAPYISTVDINTSVGYTDPIPVDLRIATQQYITAIDYYDSGIAADPQSSTFTVRHNNPYGLQLLMPGELNIAGNGVYPNGGKSVNISTPVAGTQFFVRANLVDKYFNICKDIITGPDVYIYTNDPYDIDPATVTMSYGVVDIPVTLVKKSTSTYIKLYPSSAIGNDICTANNPSNICLNNDQQAKSVFKVYASTATKLHITLPGENIVEGYCNTSPPCKFDQIQNPNPGKNGIPIPYTIDSGPLNIKVYLVDNFYNITTEQTGALQDTNPIAVMPDVKLIFLNDTKITPPANQTLSNGYTLFSTLPKTSSNTYTVIASTSSSTVSYSSGSASLVVWPAPVSKLKYTMPSTTVVAGVAFDAYLGAYDQYDNLCSTGPNIYLGTVTFIVTNQSNPNQQPSLISPTTNFFTSDKGFKYLPLWFTLKKAGTDYIGAIDINNPLVYVNPLQEIKILPGDLYGFKVNPYDDTLVGAGSVSNPGRQLLTAQAVDAYDNNISSQGVAGYIQIAEVSGSTGSLEWQDTGTGFWYNIGTSTVWYTNSLGIIGTDIPLSYKVSSKANDWARIWIGTTTINTLPGYIAKKQNVTGRLVTKGGIPTKLVWVSTPAYITVGIDEVPGAGGLFTVERRDDFDNVSTDGDLIIYPTLLSSHVDIHTNLGKVMGTFGTFGDYGFRNLSNTGFIPQDTIYNGQSQVSFRYHDRVASFSGVSPSSNTAEGGRPGYWRIEARSGSLAPAVYDLETRPLEVSKVSIVNNPRTLVAGKITDYVGTTQEFEAQLRDMFDNPSVATYTYTIQFSTFIRESSKYNDYFGFSLSTNTDLVYSYKFALPTSTAEINSNYYKVKFYYIDTKASDEYSVYLPTKPIISANVVGKIGWEASTQSVKVVPDYTYQIGFRQGQGQSVVAGTTSQMLIVSLEDYFGNRTPVVTEDSTGTGVGFYVMSTSSGSFRVSWPDDQNFVSTRPATIRMSLGQSTTSFYFTDTLATYNSTHTLTVDTIIEKNWQIAITTYSIIPASPHHLNIETPSRRLIAGTTVQYADYALGITTPTNITVSIRDIFDNVTTTSSIVNITVTSTRTTVYGGILPDEETIPSNPNWRLLSVNPLNTIIPPGSSNSTYYIWDTIVGTFGIVMSGSVDSVILSSVTQNHYITPNKADYITLHHPYTFTNPLGVLQNGFVTIKMRDKFGNLATGDHINGQYYTGTIISTNNSIQGADFRDLNTNNTYYTFTPSDQGVRVFRLVDRYIETLNIRVTDYANPQIYGYTNDAARGKPVSSDIDVPLSGILVTPVDMAPEDPLPPNKVSMGLYRTSLYQGDGLVNGSPAPVAMMRLTMQTKPSGTVDGILKALIVKSSGTLPPGDVREIGLYWDNPSDGQAGLFDGEDVLGGIPKDILISTGVWDVNQQGWRFEELDIKNSTATLITNIPKNYFIAVRISTTATVPTSLGLVIDNPTLITVSTNIGVAYNNFPIATSTSPVTRAPAEIQIAGEDIAAWWQPTAMPLGKYSYVEQGQSRVGMLKIKAWTNEFYGYIRTVKVIKTGDGNPADIKSMRLFLDSIGGDPSLGDGDFQFSIDKEITDPLNPPVIDVNDPNMWTLPIQYPSIDGFIDTSSRTYFVVYEFDEAAIPNTYHGARIDADGIVTEKVASFSPIVSSTIPVFATGDIVRLEDVNRSAPNDFSKPSFLTQNDKNKPVVRMTLKINAAKGSALWKGIKLDRWIVSSENGGTPVYNKYDDVTSINVWYDIDKDGLFDETKDRNVNLPSINKRVFPASKLFTPITATDTTSIRVADISVYFPVDSPFPPAPGRLIINDDQPDPSLKEVVYYSSVDFINNSFTQITRGAEGTLARDWSSGTVISGQAVIPLVGDENNPDGQVIYPQEKDYFITYDISPLAYVSDYSNLGIAIRTTDYFNLQSPKIMSTYNIGVTPPGKSVSLVSRMREYADKVVIIATETTHGPTLQQKAKDQPVLNLEIKTDIADAKWRWIMIYATGSVISEGSALNDVEAVKIYYDQDNNGFLDTTKDVFIGSGTFGNTIYGPLVARVDFSTAVRVMTEFEAQSKNLSQRYFVTYDIKESAMPNDQFGNQRYLGAYIKSDSLPQNSPLFDDPAKNSISLPNYIDLSSSTLPYSSMLREIIAAPSTVTVVATPLRISTDNVVSPAIILTQNITTPGPQDAAWTVNTTTGLADSGYLVVDNEIIKYNSIAPGALLFVDRGQFGSPVVNHTSGTVLTGSIYQGKNNWPIMKMTLTTPGYGVRWEGVKFTRNQPAPLNGYDSDVLSLKVWLDNANGVFDRDPITGQNLSDYLIGTGRFGEVDSMGKVTVYVKDPRLGPNQNYVILGSTPTNVFVTVDISPTSNFSHILLDPPNDVTGTNVVDPEHFIFGPSYAGHTANLPQGLITSGANVILPEINTITVTPEDISPAYTTQNDKDVGVLSLKMKVNKTSAKVEAIRLKKTGTANDTDINLVKVFEDSNNNCIFDIADKSKDENGAYKHLMSFGNESFAQNQVAMVLKKPLVVTTTTACFFIAYDISQFAVLGSTVGLLLPDTSYFTVSIPNDITLSTYPVNTYPMLIQEVGSDVRMGFYDIADEVVVGGGVGQAQRDVPVLRFNMKTDAGFAKWYSMKLRRTGASNDPQAPFGKNTDVKFIKIYRDANQNDMLDINDVNVSEKETKSVNLFTSTDSASQITPFELVVESTEGFASKGYLMLSDAELVYFSTVGWNTIYNKPYLGITSRGMKLGESYTPEINHFAGSKVKKVDLYDQEKLLELQAEINLSETQILSPLPQTFFIAYDIGETAVPGNKVGALVNDNSWINVNYPHNVNQNIYVNVSKFNPEGTRTQAFPFSSSLIPVRAVYLNVNGIDISPLSAEINKNDLPVMSLKLKSTQDFIRIGQFNFYQTGTIEESITGVGDGDFKAVSVWKDMDNDGSFSPLFDKRLGITYWSSTSTFKNGITVNIMENQLPYITITTNTTILHILINTGDVDASSTTIIGHKAGIMINNFSDIKGPSGLPLAAGQYFSDRYPVSINKISIVSGNIKLTPVYSPVIYADNGYPAYALLDSSGNVVIGSNGYPVADETKWIYSSTQTSCKAGEPLIDINGDGKPDNFDYFNSGRCVNISLNNSPFPSFDIDGDRIIDFETNLDYIPDKIVDNGWKEPLYFVGDRYQNQRLYYSVPQVGAVPTAWSSKTNELIAKWQPATTSVVRYEVTVGENYRDVSGIKKSWDPVGDTLSGAVKNISLSPGNITVLTSRITLDSSSFTVKDASNFSQEGVVYVGSEIMIVSKIDNQTFKIIERGVQGSYASMHTPWGEVVSDRAYIVSVRALTAGGGYIPNENGTPVLIFRIDTTKPTTPGAPQPQVPEGVAAGTSYSLKWTNSTDPESNIMAYEIQERENTSPIWKTINGIPGYKYGGGINNLYSVGDPVVPGEKPRAQGNYYTYRIRAWNFAGLASDWSEVSKPAATTIGQDIIQKVDAYPNPVDLRKGGKEGKVTIAYILNDDAEVTISIYDLLGYLVKEIKISRGNKGAQMGSNYIEWNGKNDLGGIVSKGGYIVRIKASSPKGSKSITKKIGIIH